MNTVLETVAEWAAPATKVNGDVIPGVKIVGYESPSHKRRYPKEVLSRDASKYEGARVFIDHPEGIYNPSASRVPRPAGSHLGRIRNPRVDEARGLIGDLHVMPTHPLASSVKWAAENDPTAYALSHLADLIGTRDGAGWFNTNSIDKVHSVDVVSNGGTTAGLFESAAMSQEGDRTMEQPTLASMTREAIQAARQDLKVLTVAEHHALEQKAADFETKLKAAEAKATAAEAKVEGFEATEKKRTKDGERLKLIGEAKLPEHLNTESFRTTCLGSTDEQFTALLADRKTLAASTNGKLPPGPSSSSRTAAEAAGTRAPTKDSKEFAGVLKGR